MVKLINLTNFVHSFLEHAQDKYFQEQTRYQKIQQV